MYILCHVTYRYTVHVDSLPVLALFNITASTTTTTVRTRRRRRERAKRVPRAITVELSIACTKWRSWR